MIIQGGYAEKNFLNDAYCFNLEDFNWHEIQSTNERKNIYHHKSIIYQDEMIIFGGHNGSYCNYLLIKKVNDIYFIQFSHKLLKETYNSFENILKNNIYSDLKFLNPKDGEIFNLH
jgi:N-acetylneuraminic acid mutarotase